MFARAAVSLAAMVAALAACGDPGLVNSDDGYAHPTGADELVLRVEDTGGFVPREFFLTRIPSFSLLGDGTVVTVGPQITIYPGPALPNLLATDVTEAGVQRILREAEEAGLFGPDRHYEHPGIADASTTVFTLVAEGRRHRISAYALGHDDGAGMIPEEDRRARQKLARFREFLGGLRERLPEGSVGQERPYEIKALRVWTRPYREPQEQPADQPEREVRDWPLEDGLATFGDKIEDDLRCGVVSGADLDRLMTEVREANQLTLWRSAGKRYEAFFRPLLPDETGCPERVEGF